MVERAGCVCVAGGGGGGGVERRGVGCRTDKITILAITKTCLCNFDPLKPHFYLVKLGFTGV